MGGYNEVTPGGGEQLPVRKTSPTQSDSTKGSSMSGDQKMAIAAIAMSNFSVNLASAMLAPFFPQEAAAKGASDTIIGLIFGASQLTICILSPIYGSMVSRAGPRYLSLSGLFICTICSILFGTLSRSPNGTPYIAMCFLCSTMDANGVAMLTTASYSTLAVEFPQHVSLVLGILETCIGAAYLVGPLFGGFLYSVGGFELPFFVIGGLQLISLILSSLLLPKVECKGGGDRFLSLLATPGAVVAFLSVFSETFALSFLEPILGKHLLSMDSSVSTTVIGAIFMVQCATYSLSAPVAGWLCDKGYVKALMLSGSVITMLGMLLIGPSPALPFLPRPFWLVVASLGLLGLGMGVCWLPTFQLLLGSALRTGRGNDLGTLGVVSGLFSCGWALGAFAGPSLAGYLEQLVGFQWATTLCAALCFVMAMLTAAFIMAGKRKSKEPVRVRPSSCTNEQCKKADERMPLISSTEKARREVQIIV